MAGKKTRAFFICPRWAELAGQSGPGTDKVVASIAAGRPVPRSSLRRALVAVARRSGKLIDLDAYMVDQRTVSAGKALSAKTQDK